MLDDLASNVVGPRRPNPHERPRDSDPAADNGGGHAAIERLLRERGVRWVSFDDWTRLDALEVARGKELGKIREKFSSIEQMLDAIGVETLRLTSRSPAGTHRRGMYVGTYSALAAALFLLFYLTGHAATRRLAPLPLERSARGEGGAAPGDGRGGLGHPPVRAGRAAATATGADRGADRGGGGLGSLERVEGASAPSRRAPARQPDRAARPARDSPARRRGGRVGRAVGADAAPDRGLGRRRLPPHGATPVPRARRVPAHSVQRLFELAARGAASLRAGDGGQGLRPGHRAPLRVRRGADRSARRGGGARHDSAVGRDRGGLPAAPPGVPVRDPRRLRRRRLRVLPVRRVPRSSSRARGRGRGTPLARSRRRRLRRARRGQAQRRLRRALHRDRYTWGRGCAAARRRARWSSRCSRSPRR